MKFALSRAGLLSTLLLLVAALAPAADWKSLKPQGYVSDFANVIDARSRAAIEDYAARVEKATGVQLAFVTVPALDGQPIEDVGNDIFRSFGVGRRKEDDGAMVLLSIQDRRSRLEVGGGLGEFVPDSMAGLLLDDMRPALRAGDYGVAMITAAERLGSTIAQAKGVQIAAPQYGRRVQRETRDSLPWPLILLGIFLLLAFLRRGGGGGYRGGGGGGFWTGLLLSQLLSGGRRGSGGGGGFGGYDSGGGGGGFGGFGGGDSGGGGASSDW
jgi:uncharacterized protein